MKVYGIPTEFTSQSSRNKFYILALCIIKSLVHFVACDNVLVERQLVASACLHCSAWVALPKVRSSSQRSTSGHGPALMHHSLARCRPRKAPLSFVPEKITGSGVHTVHRKQHNFTCCSCITFLQYGRDDTFGVSGRSLCWEWWDQKLEIFSSVKAKAKVGALIFSCSCSYATRSAQIKWRHGARPAARPLRMTSLVESEP